MAISAAVMLPTYNEAENIREMVTIILNLPADLMVVIVDDNSPDGTGKIADELVQENPGRVHVVHRTGVRGRGVAGVDGFKYCLNLPVRYIFEMDADLSHDPRDIPKFLEVAPKADVVIGSRYIRGGGESNRVLHRRIISRFANAYLRFALGLSIRDCSSGYRCFDRRVLDEIGLAAITSDGPPILTEILWRCKQRRYRIAEVPIIFHERERGTSKLNGKILLNSLAMPLNLRFKGDKTGK